MEKLTDWNTAILFHFDLLPNCHCIVSGPRLKDGANNDNIQRSLEKTVEVESKDDGCKTDSPFNELYQMIKHSLVTPRKPAGQQPQTPATKNATPRPQPGLITKVVMQAAAATADAVSTPSKDEIKSQVVAPAKSPKKHTPKTSLPAQETPKKAGLSLPAQTPITLKACVVAVQQVSVEAPATPLRRKSKTAAPVKPSTEEQLIPTQATCATPTAAQAKPSPRVSPRSVEKTLKAHSLKKELEAKAAASGKYSIQMICFSSQVLSSLLALRTLCVFSSALNIEVFECLLMYTYFPSPPVRVTGRKENGNRSCSQPNDDEEASVFRGPPEPRAV